MNKSERDRIEVVRTEGEKETDRSRERTEIESVRERKVKWGEWEQ